jgi:hypothetical protein
MKKQWMVGLQKPDGTGYESRLVLADTALAAMTGIPEADVAFVSFHGYVQDPPPGEKEIAR